MPSCRVAAFVVAFGMLCLTTDASEGALGLISVDLQSARAELSRRLPAIEAAGGGQKTRAMLTVMDVFSDWIAKDFAHGKINCAERESLDLLSAASNELARLDRVAAGDERDFPSPRYVTSPVEIHGADIVGERVWPDGRRERGCVLLNGFGHFWEAQRDLEKFPSLGNHLLQMEVGPAAVMPAENVRTVDAALAPFFEAAKRAEKANVQICLLLSPHYFPDWARNKWPEVNDCGKASVFKFCLYDKRAWGLIDEYLRLVIPRVRGTRALHSVCLTNEPAQDDHGTNCVLRTVWSQHLVEKFGTVQKLNAVWGTAYGSLDEIAMPSDGTKLPKSRLAYEYLLFNRKAHAAFHRHMAKVVKELAPELPVHCKIMMADNFQNLHSYFSVDPEDFAQFSDYNGNDCYDWPPPSDPYGYANEWWWMAAGYDYQRSAADKPVFDTEIHLMMDRCKTDITPAHVYGSLWQQVLHGMSLGTQWTWQRAYDDGKGDFNGLIVERPSCLVAWAACSLDLNRLADVLSPMRNAKPTILVHWPVLSQILSGDRGGHFLNAYRAASFLGQPLGVATETMLIRLGRDGVLGRPFEETRVLLLPNCPDLPEGVSEGLDVLRRKGVKIVSCRGSDTELFATFAREMFGWNLPPLSCVRAETSDTPVFGVETHACVIDGVEHVSAINHLDRPVRVRFPRSGRDLVTGRKTDASETLQPEMPVLIRFGMTGVERASAP